jgi:hypothetical protein
MWGIPSKKVLDYQAANTLPPFFWLDNAATGTYTLCKGNKAVYDVCFIEVDKALTKLSEGDKQAIFGEAIYETKPLWWEAEKNFALQNGDDVYLFCHDLCRKGSADVTYNGGSEGDFVFENFPYALADVHWMDNDEALESSYADGNLTVNFTGYPYGTDYCVRVAKATLVR